MTRLAANIISTLPSAVQKIAFDLARHLRVDLLGIPDPMDDLRKLSKQSMPSAILDIGAHHGQTVAALRKHFTKTPIHCFEPFPDSFRQLQRNVEVDPSTFCHEVALSNQNGYVDFHSNINSQTNSILENDKGNIENIESSLTLKKTTVSSRTLDSFYSEKINLDNLFIKADVQGAELLLIQGATEVLSQHTNVFLCEASLAPLYKEQADLFSIHNLLCNELSFDLFQIYRTRSDKNGKALWCDAAWVKRGFFT